MPRIESEPEIFLDDSIPERDVEHRDRPEIPDNATRLEMMSRDELQLAGTDPIVLMLFLVGMMLIL